ncbi:hypothetical protein ACNFNZ_12740 [Empedobacter brevis]
MKKNLLYFICVCLLFLTSLKAQEMKNGALKASSTYSESFKPFVGEWEAEKDNKIIKIKIKLDKFWVSKKALNDADKTKPNYSLDMSYKVYDKLTKKIIADSKQGDNLEPLGWKKPTVNINQEYIQESNYYKLKTIDKSNIKSSYSFTVRDYKNCFTKTAVKLTLLPSNKNQLIWKSEILESQDWSYEEEFNCTILEPEETSKLTIPLDLTFKRVK